MSNITELQSVLFDTLNALRNKDNPMEIERAKAICDVGQVIINSAKAEIDFAKVNGSVDSMFFKKPGINQPLLQNKPEQHNDFDESESIETAAHKTATGVVTIDQRNGQRIVTHKLK